MYHDIPTRAGLAIVWIASRSRRCQPWGRRWGSGRLCCFHRPRSSRRRLLLFLPGWRPSSAPGLPSVGLSLPPPPAPVAHPPPALRRTRPSFRFPFSFSPSPFFASPLARLEFDARLSSPELAHARECFPSRRTSSPEQRAHSFASFLLSLPCPCRQSSPPPHPPSTILAHVGDRLVIFSNSYPKCSPRLIKNERGEWRGAEQVCPVPMTRRPSWPA